MMETTELFLAQMYPSFFWELFPMIFASGSLIVLMIICVIIEKIRRVKNGKKS